MLKKILNAPEERVFQSLMAVCDRHSAHVFPKVRVADVIEVNDSGITDDLFGFALKAHFDLVVTGSDRTPLFAVEFDGHYHQTHVQRGRDAKKDTLCRRFLLPLLRVNGDMLDRTYRRVNLLSWFAECWFASACFAEAQSRGEIPYDEDFDTTSFVTLPGHDRPFPLWLSAAPKAAVRKLCHEGRCIDSSPAVLFGEGDDGDWHGMSCIRVDDRVGVRAYTRAKAQLFPVSMFDFMQEIVPFGACQRLIDVLDDRENPEPVETIMRAAGHFRDYVRPLVDLNSEWLG